MKDNLEMEQADVFINSAYDEINRLKDGIEQGKYSADELDQIITRANRKGFLYHKTKRLFSKHERIGF